jgi:hypothetical protein
LLTSHNTKTWELCMYDVNVNECTSEASKNCYKNFTPKKLHALSIHTIDF